jgi:tripartite-type tricarboxylate transporter receptor subunit TctC
MATGPQDFEALIKTDLAKWEKVVKTAGIKGE